MQYIIDAENIKCGGCASAIQDALGKLDGVQTVNVDVDSGRVTITADDGLRAVLAATLEASGYPEKQGRRPV
jgi:copper chaperone